MSPLPCVLEAPLSLSPILCLFNTALLSKVQGAKTTISGIITLTNHRELKTTLVEDISTFAKRFILQSTFELELKLSAIIN
jgi:hypothetical protein